MPPQPFGISLRLRAAGTRCAASVIGWLALAIGGCGSVSEESEPRAEADVACIESPVRLAVAASLREVAESLAAELERAPDPIRLRMSFGASSALARQLEFGAPVDVLLSADAELMQSLARKDMIVADSIREIARGRLVLAGRSGSSFEAIGVEALRSPRLKRLGLPGRAVPLGRYGYRWLEGQGLLEDLAGKIVMTENARANRTALEQGHVDLAIFYETDLRLSTTLEAIHRPSPDDYPPIRYVSGRARAAANCPSVDRVLETWLSASARARLAAAGFQMPLPAGSIESPIRAVDT